jgi:hypothetical protein
MVHEEYEADQYTSIGKKDQQRIELGGVGHCYAWHVRVTSCVGNVHSLSYFQFEPCIFHTNNNIEGRTDRGGKEDKREVRRRQDLCIPPVPPFVSVSCPVSLPTTPSPIHLPVFSNLNSCIHYQK